MYIIGAGAMVRNKVYNSNKSHVSIHIVSIHNNYRYTVLHKCLSRKNSIVIQNRDILPFKHHLESCLLSIFQQVFFKMMLECANFNIDFNIAIYFIPDYHSLVAK